jgi:hypothetical protein
MASIAPVLIDSPDMRRAGAQRLSLALMDGRMNMVVLV